MKAILLTVGDELLRGEVVNSNAARVGQVLEAAGIPLVKILTVGESWSYS